jgi:DNA primase
MRTHVIGQDTLDRIRRETDLVALIGESLKLSKRGRSFVGLCPFHKEKSPSFHVNPERGFYHCFGCHESGDAIKFVQKLEGLDFIEAVKRLAERTGIEFVDNVSDAERREQAEARRRSEELFEVSDVAAAYFERMLREHPLASFARDELARRSLVPEQPTDSVADALQAFRVGYAPYGWDGLSKHLRDSRSSLSAAQKVGLVLERKSGSGYYDRFRHRLMFAVMDTKGRVVAFSGRSLDEPLPAKLHELNLEPPSATADKPAKYMNSPESPIYRKREALFGIHQARQGIRAAEHAMLVEGNFDVVTLHAVGLKNVVAPLGTAFTVEQATQLKRITPELILLFDGDAAGRRAAVLAARETCQRANLNGKVVVLPDGSDPDEFVRTRGADPLRALAKVAKPLLEFLIDDLFRRTPAPGDAKAKSEIAEEFLSLIEGVKDPTQARLAEDEWADRLCVHLGVRTPQGVATIRELARRKVPMIQDAPMIAPAYRARSPDQRDKIGLEIIGAYLDFPELADEQGDEIASLLEGESAAAYAALRQNWSAEAGRDAEDLLAKLPASIHAFARARLAAPKHQKPEDARTELSGNVRQLKALVLSRETKAVAEELGRGARDFEQETRMLGALFQKARERKVLASD